MATKSSAKGSTKTTSKTASKTSPKSASKSSPKAAPKAATKAAPKASTKAASKEPVKATAKISTKSTPKAPEKEPAKSPAKASTQEPVKASSKETAKVKKELTIGDKLDKLYELQSHHSSLDKINVLRGELPMEVADLEDDIVGLETRIANIKSDIEAKQAEITQKKTGVKESEALIARYKSQLDNVKNNREYDALSKEVELQELEIQLCQKKSKEFAVVIDQSKEVLKETEERLDTVKKNLKAKKVELEKIIKETEKEEDSLHKKISGLEGEIEDRLLTAYGRVRSNYRNGLAVVTVERDSCGGCFGMVPPQMQMDIRQRKKIILCEHCGRILVAVGTE